MVETAIFLAAITAVLISNICIRWDNSHNGFIGKILMKEFQSIAIHHLVIETLLTGCGTLVWSIISLNEYHLLAVLYHAILIHIDITYEDPIIVGIIIKVGLLSTTDSAGAIL